MVSTVPVILIDNSAGVSSPAQITSNQNNYDPGTYTTVLRLSTDAARTITGFVGGSAGRAIVIQNVGLNSIVLAHNSASSLAANRFSMGSAADYTLTAGKSIQLIYDATSSFWRDLGSSGGATSTTWTPVSATATGSSQGITIPESGLTENDLYVAVNGLLQTPQTDYTLSGTTLTMTAEAGTTIVVRKNLGPMGTPATGYGYLANTANLSDLQNPATARTNLGVLAISNNLSDLNNAATARTNLGLTVANSIVFWTGSDNIQYVTANTVTTSATPQTLTDATTISWDANNGYNAKVTLGGNRTLGAMANPKLGVTYTLQITQDATGSRTLTWNSCYDFAAAGTPTLSTGANKIDFVFMYCYDASTPKFRCSFNKSA